MRRALIASIAALLVLSASPGWAQETIGEGQGPFADTGSGSLRITETALLMDGKPVDAASHGVPVTLRLTFRNATSETLPAVNVTIETAREDAMVVDAEASLGDLDPGASADAEFVFELTGECVDFVGFGGQATTGDETIPMKIAIPVHCPGPRLAVTAATFAGGDGDTVPEPGETLRVTFELLNHGRDPARNVRASVQMRGDGLRAAGTELEWPDIEPGGSARNTTPLILSIDPEAPRQDACPRIVPEPVEDPGVASDTAVDPPDTAVSSDGRGTGTVDVAEAPASSVEPEPMPVELPPEQVEPYPGPPETVEPAPMPMPVEPQPDPSPAEEDQPVLVLALMEITTTGYETAAEWSSQTFCALSEGAPAGDRGLTASHDRDDAGSRGGAAVPVAAAAAISAIAVLARRLLLG